MNPQIQAILGAILLASVGAAPANEANPATFGIGRGVLDIFGRGRHGHRGRFDSYDREYRDDYGRGRRGRFGSDDYDGDFDAGRSDFSDY